MDGREVATIGRGLLLLVGIGAGDRDGEVVRLAEKVAHLRVFPDDRGKMNRSLLDVEGECLVVSQFTLYGDVRKGRRPSWTDAADPGVAAERIDAFARSLEGLGVRVRTGRFGAHMGVELVNDGPVTLILDAAEL